jgi:hypothetical protein
MSAYTTYFANPVQVGSTIDNMTGDNGNVVLATNVIVGRVTSSGATVNAVTQSFNLPGTARILRITAERVDVTALTTTTISIGYTAGGTQVVNNATIATNQVNTPLTVSGSYTIANNVGTNAGQSFGTFYATLGGTGTAGTNSDTTIYLIVEYLYQG